jgi:hypothetical protein
MSKKRLAAAHARTRPDDGHAFVEDPTEHEAPPTQAGEDADAADSLAEELAEEFVVAATSNEDVGEQRFEQESVSEVGGPFLEVSSGAELVDDADANNPPGTTRAPFPTAMRGDLQPPPSRVTRGAR